MKLGSLTNLNKPISSTAMASDGLIESYGRLENLPLLAGFNTVFGSCVPTAICNYVRITFGRAGRTDTMTDQTCLDVYSAVTGFKQKDPATDQGTDPELMLDWFMNNTICGATLKSYTRIDHKNEAAIRNSIIKTGAVFLVFEMTTEQENAKEWFPIGNPGSWGGHGVSGNSYSGAAYYVISWGGMIPADRSLFNANGYLIGAYELDIQLPEEEPGITTLTDQQVMALTLWGEARGEGKEGMQAVANVIVNRAKKPGWYGHDIRSVCLAPWQFSCWNMNGGERPQMLAAPTTDPQLQIAANLSELAFQGILPDVTEGADSYFAVSIPPPSFAKPEDFTVQIGHHKFYKVLT